MTQKSAARKERDAQAAEHKEHLKTNTAWADLEELYVSIATALARTWEHVVGQFSDEAVIRNTDPAKYKEIMALFQGLDSDVQSLVEELIAIHALHKDKTGGSRTDEDFTTTVTIYEQYHSVQERMAVLVMGNAQIILEHAARAITTTAVKELESEDPTNLDVNVVTDVQAKPVA